MPQKSAELATSPVSDTDMSASSSLSVTQVNQGTKQTLDLSNLRKIPSTVSLSATRPTSPSAYTPVTPSLTVGTSTATDDEDTDFQSAYSASPRASHGSFENYSLNTYDVNNSEQNISTEVSASHLDDFGTITKGRASGASRPSTATGRERASTRASEDTVTAGRIGTSH